MRLTRSSVTVLSLLLALPLPAAEPATKAAPPAKARVAAKPKGAAPTGAPAASGVPKVEFEKYRLPNGLQVILHVDRKLPIVNVNQWFHVGSKNERTGRTGFAHLFEHMMFQGSKNVPGEYFSHVEKAGANLQEGGVNGTTNTDRTNYFATVPSGNLENVLWLESDRLATLADAITKESLDNQRDVVKNERRQGLENTPYGRAFKLIFENLFPAGHPYSWPVIGSHEDLTAASLDDVKDFFRTWYTPNNLTLTLAGDFDKEQAKTLIAKYFGPIPAGPPVDRPRVSAPVLSGEKVIEATDRVPQERTYMVWAGAPYFSADEAPFDVAATILSDGLSSRLNKALVYDKPLCTAVTAFHFGAEIGGAFIVQATARPGVSLAEVEDVVTAEIAKLARSGPTPAELNRAKTKTEFGFIQGLERIGGFGGKADLLAQYNTYLGEPGKFDADVMRYRGVTAEAVKSVAARALDNRNRLLVRFRPEISGRAEGTVDRTVEPALGADRPFRAPTVQTAKLPNGLELFVVEKSELPKVSVTLVTRAGVVADPAGKAGLANMVIRTIDMGTKTRKALEIEDALGDLGTSLGGNAARESSTLGFEVLKRNLEPALAIAADVVLNPVFPAADVDREKKRQLDALAQAAKNGNQVAGRVRGILAFGAEHPYGRPGQGLPGTVEKITREDLASFHATYWKPGSSALVFVGDVTLAEATALATKAFGSWTGGAAPAVAIPAPRPAAAGRIYVVDRQDAAQTVVSQFLPAPARQTPDYDALNLADAVWGGGGFGTRLNLNLREEKGYSYGVFSFLGLNSKSGIWNAGGGVQTNKTKESVVEFDKELKNLAGAKPITEAEFADAKLKKIRGYSQQFEADGRIAGQIAQLWTLGLPMAELQAENDRTAKVTLEEARTAAAKWADPKKASLVLVGDLAKIEAGLKELNLGEIVVLDVEGNPATR